VYRFSSIIIRMLDYRINDFECIVYRKQSNWVVGRHVLREGNLLAEIGQIYRDKCLPFSWQRRCIRAKGPFIGRISDSLFRHRGCGAID
jgi:hypothetical protein